ncbi:MAG: T9SS type A sorting domain-containing protein [Bacteroidetes bacterium]|nr:T9SS type A sorting domain-containing protein [Bacteroidota bacterium]
MKYHLIGFFVIVIFFNVVSQNNLCLSPAGNPVMVGVIPYNAKFSDLNNDGAKDFICSFMPYSFAVTLSNGSGGYLSPVYYQTSSIYSCSLDFQVADYNNDGNQDIALTDTNSIGIKILLGNGSGAYTTTLNFPCGQKPFFFNANDFNMDGVADLAIVNSVSNGFSVLVNNGLGSFSSPSFVSCNNAEKIQCVDFNNDGKKDLVIIRDSSRALTLFKGFGNGAFSPVSTYSFGFSAREIISGDFNNDGKMDLACISTGSAITVITGNGLGAFVSAVNYNVSPTIERICSGDLNSDGRKDILALSGFSADFSVLLGSNSGSLLPPIDFFGVFDSTTCNFSVSHFYAAVTDVNNDGKDDVLLGPDNCQKIFTMLNCNTQDVGIVKKENPNRITIFPNPARDAIKVCHNLNVNESINLKILNNLGMPVIEVILADNLVLDVSNLTPGFYTIFFSTKTNIIKEKFVILR